MVSKGLPIPNPNKEKYCRHPHPQIEVCSDDKAIERIQSRASCLGGFLGLGERRLDLLIRNSFVLRVLAFIRTSAGISPQRAVSQQSARLAKAEAIEEGKVSVLPLANFRRFDKPFTDFRSDLSCENVTPALQIRFGNKSQGRAALRKVWGGFALPEFRSCFSTEIPFFSRRSNPEMLILMKLGVSNSNIPIWGQRNG